MDRLGGGPLCCCWGLVLVWAVAGGRAGEAGGSQGPVEGSQPGAFASGWAGYCGAAWRPGALSRPGYRAAAAPRAGVRDGRDARGAAEGVNALLRRR